MAEQLTLQDYAASPKPLVSGVAKILQEESKFMDVLPFQDVGTLSVEVIQEGSLPSTIAWRDIGEDHGSYRATNPGKKQEHAFSFGNVIEIDKAIIKDKATRLYNPRTYQTEMVTRAMAREFTDAAINGAQTANSKRPVGLKWRIANDLGSDQTMYGNTSSAALDLSPDAASRSTAISTFWFKMDELFQRVQGGTPDYLLCNDTFLTYYWDFARNSGLMSTSKDNLGREFTSYKGVKFLPMGFKLDDTTRIMTNTEVVAGTADTGSTCTSIIAVKLGPAYFTGWQEYGLEVLNKSYKDSADGLTESIIIDWVVGLALSHPRSAARMCGLQLT
jgi:hypothetical protein